MIPLSLRLRNFMSYGQEGGELDLRNIHLACLSGANGNGKSALVDAITWALWGRSRARREDDLLRQGTTEMEVEFEFACGGALYRVIRKRTVRKSASSAILELHVRDGEIWRAITGNHIGDTEGVIANLLRLSYETFINSSLLLQGKADLFTTKAPAERKAVLAEILGLGQYDELAEAARARERDYKAQVERHELRIADLDRFLGGLSTIEADLAGTEADLAAAQTARAAAETTVADLDGRLRALEGLHQSLGRIDARLAEIERDETQARSLQAVAVGRRAQAEALLADEPAIRAQLAELEAVRRENDRLAGLVNSIRDLEGRAAELRQRVAAERGRLQNEQRQIERQIEEAMTSERCGRERLADLERLMAVIGALPVALDAREALVADERAGAERISALEATNAVLDTQRKELRKRIESLRAAGAECPTCGSPLSEARRQETLDAAMAEGLQCKALVEGNLAEIAALRQEETARKAQIAARDREIARLQAECKREGQLTAEIAACREQAARIPAFRDELERVQTLLETGAFALDEADALDALTAEIAAIGYDAEAHRALGDQIRVLAGAERMRAQLDEARDALARASTDIASCESRILALVDERARLAADRDPLLAATVGIPALRTDLQSRRGALTDLRAREGALQERLGRLRRQIEEGAARTQERREASRARDEAARQAQAYKDLAQIFGWRGIPAMLIENALPELEQSANELLARMTDNSTQVQFVTQRQGTGGKIVEVLDIKIADSMGTRNYELFSGGEAFRINFAIRIALSKLLARRAGADLSFLLIDEGFGSQDAQGRDRLVEAITSISDDFEKILVVTHIDELKELFDVHVEVSKGLGGSQITISAA